MWKKNIFERLFWKFSFLTNNGVFFSTITVAVVMPYEILYFSWIHKVVSSGDGKFIFIAMTGNPVIAYRSLLEAVNSVVRQSVVKLCLVPSVTRKLLHTIVVSHPVFVQLIRKVSLHTPVTQGLKTSPFTPGSLEALYNSSCCLGYKTSEK